jgi:hypothetical protein
MPAMHQPVQQRAGEQQQIGQETKEVRPVLCDQKESDNDKEAKQDQAHPGAEPVALLGMVLMAHGFILHRE